MKGWCVYILKGTRYYVGSTNDIVRRIKEHTLHGYSAKRIGKWKCLGFIPCKDRVAARALEHTIKKSCHPERSISLPEFQKYVK